MSLLHAAPPELDDTTTSYCTDGIHGNDNELYDIVPTVRSRRRMKTDKVVRKATNRNLTDKIEIPDKNENFCFVGRFLSTFTAYFLGPYNTAARQTPMHKRRPPPAAEELIFRHMMIDLSAQSLAGKQGTEYVPSSTAKESLAGSEATTVMGTLSTDDSDDFVYTDSSQDSTEKLPLYESEDLMHETLLGFRLENPIANETQGRCEHHNSIASEANSNANLSDESLVNSNAVRGDRGFDGEKVPRFQKDNPAASNYSQNGDDELVDGESLFGLHLGDLDFKAMGPTIVSSGPLSCPEADQACDSTQEDSWHEEDEALPFSHSVTLATGKFIVEEDALTICTGAARDEFLHELEEELAFLNSGMVALKGPDSTQACAQITEELATRSNATMFARQKSKIPRYSPSGSKQRSRWQKREIVGATKARGPCSVVAAKSKTSMQATGSPTRPKRTGKPVDLSSSRLLRSAGERPHFPKEDLIELEKKFKARPLPEFYKKSKGRGLDTILEGCEPETNTAKNGSPSLLACSPKESAKLGKVDKGVQVPEGEQIPHESRDQLDSVLDWLLY